MGYTDYQLEQAWMELENVPVNEDEILDADADLSYGIRFDKGTPKEDVWHFFDKNHSKGVAWLLYEFDSNKDYSKNVEIGEIEESDYMYALYKRDEDGEFTDLYTDINSDIPMFDTVVDCLNYIKSNGLNCDISEQELQSFIVKDMGNLGGTLMALTETAIDELNGCTHLDLLTTEDIIKTYSKAISSFEANAGRHRASIEAEIECIWDFSHDYRENPEMYFDYCLSLAETLIRYAFENEHSEDLALAYLNEVGKNSSYYFETFKEVSETEDKEKNSRGSLVMEIYSFPESEYPVRREGFDYTAEAYYDGYISIDDYSKKSEEYFPLHKTMIISLDDLHYPINEETEAIPREWFNRLYSLDKQDKQRDNIER